MSIHFGCSIKTRFLSLSLAHLTIVSQFQTSKQMHIKSFSERHRQHNNSNMDYIKQSATLMVKHNVELLLLSRRWSKWLWQHTILHRMNQSIDLSIYRYIGCCCCRRWCRHYCCFNEIFHSTDKLWVNRISRTVIMKFCICISQLKMWITMEWKITRSNRRITNH